MIRGQIRPDVAASKHKAMSYDRPVDREAQLESKVAAMEGQVEAMLTEAETVDTPEDARLGPGRREEDVPAEPARRDPAGQAAGRPREPGGRGAGEGAGQGRAERAARGAAP